MTVQAGLCRTWSEPQVVGFLMDRSKIVLKADALFQLEVARKHIPYHMEKFGYKQPNVEFVEGYIEKLTEAGIKENSQDIIM